MIKEIKAENVTTQYLVLIAPSPLFVGIPLRGGMSTPPARRPKGIRLRFPCDNILSVSHMVPPFTSQGAPCRCSHIHRPAKPAQKRQQPSHPPPPSHKQDSAFTAQGDRGTSHQPFSAPSPFLHAAKSRSPPSITHPPRCPGTPRLSPSAVISLFVFIIHPSSSLAGCPLSP